MNLIMESIEMPLAEQEIVRDSINVNQFTKRYQEQIDGFLELICPSLKQKITHQLFTKSLLKNKII